jgi:hypothetical protein
VRAKSLTIKDGVVAATALLALEMAPEAPTIHIVAMGPLGLAEEVFI